MAINSYRDLDVWNASMDLALLAYELAARLPSSERFELASQIRRAASSVPSNVAEGHATGLQRRYAHHVRIALGSLAEIDTQLELARRLGYLSAKEMSAVHPQLTRVGQLLHGVLRSLLRQMIGRGLSAMLLVIAGFWAL